MPWSREETIGRGEMREIQLRKLRNTVEYVYGKNAVYRKILDERGVKPEQVRSLDDIRRLPFTSKQLIRDHYPFGLFTAPLGEIVEFHATSGTTGKPVVVGPSISGILFLSAAGTAPYTCGPLVRVKAPGSRFAPQPR